MIKRIRSIAVLFATACALVPYARAESGDPFRYRGGLRNSPGKRKLSAKQLDAVLRSLRDKSGLIEMRFDENGFLTLGDHTKFHGGSGIARSLLHAATSTAHVVDLESHMHSPEVVFARLATPVVYHRYSSGAQIDAYPLEIDFSDLSKLRGPRQALSAFDLGFIILHELGHAAFGLRDVKGDSQGLGECEEMINLIRRELNLPERQSYVAQTYMTPALGPNRGLIRIAELIFSRAIEKQGRMKLEKFHLNWEAAMVGPSISIEDRGWEIDG